MRSKSRGPVATKPPPKCLIKKEVWDKISDLKKREISQYHREAYNKTVGRPTTNQALASNITTGTKSILGLKHCLNGCFSDPPGWAMYIEINVSKCGLGSYKSIRSSSQLVGFHYHLRSILTGWNNSPDLCDASTESFIFLWNLKAEHENLGKPNYRLTKMELIDEAQKLEYNLFKKNNFPHWIPTPLIIDSDLEGFYNI